MRVTMVMGSSSDTLVLQETFVFLRLVDTESVTGAPQIKDSHDVHLIFSLNG